MLPEKENRMKKLLRDILAHIRRVAHSYQSLVIIGCSALSALPALATSGESSKTFYTSPHQFILSTSNASEATRFRSLDLAEKTSVRCSLKGFWFSSTRPSELGSYLGIYEPSSDTYQNYIYVDAGTSSVEPQMFIHDALHATQSANPDVNQLKQKLAFNPTITVIGATLETMIRLGDFAHLSISAPWVSVSHKLHLTDLETAIPQDISNPDARVTLRDYLQGSVASTGTRYTHNQVTTEYLNAQDALTYGKWVDSQSASGIGDITVALSATPTVDPVSACNVTLFAVLPTGSGSSGVTFFEAQRGNGGHLFFGSRLGVTIPLSQPNSTFALMLSPEIGGEMGTPTTARRTLSFQFPERVNPDDENAIIPAAEAEWARYYLAGKTDEQVLFPFANVGTQKVVISPGKRFYAGVSLTAEWRWFGCSFGYSYHSVGAESLALVFPWKQDEYAIAAQGYTALAPFAATTNSFITGKSIRESDLLLSAAATPAQQLHGVEATLSLAHPPSWLPINISISGGYHFRSAQSIGVSGYTVSASLSYAF